MRIDLLSNQAKMMKNIDKNWSKCDWKSEKRTLEIYNTIRYTPTKKLYTSCCTNKFIYFSALIIMTVGGSLSARTSFFIGASITSVASMITAFIDDVNIAFFTLGIASGMIVYLNLCSCSITYCSYISAKLGLVTGYDVIFSTIVQLTLQN